MKILFVAAFSENGEEAYELYNFYKPLTQLVDSVIKFDFLKIMRDQGKPFMNQAILEIVKTEKPDITFFVPHTDQFIPKIVNEINMYTISIGYLFDDPWRIEYSRFWAKHFTYITTSDINGVKKFNDAGFSNVIYSPFACNTNFFIKKDLPKIYDVSFVGQYNPYRDWYLKKLMKAGIIVNVWGPGWKSGFINYSEMIDIFNQSRINLNLSNSISWDIRFLLALNRPIMDTLQTWRSTLRTYYMKDRKTREMVKGRHFEINACGGFQLSYYAEGLESHYQIGKEIAIYESIEEMIDKIRYYLKYKEDRELIAQKGYKRTLQEHDMGQRYRSIFNQLGLNVIK